MTLTERFDKNTKTEPNCCPVCGQRIILEGIRFQDGVLYFHNNMVHMTPTEVKVVYMLYSRPGQVVSREMIYSEIYPSYLPDSGDVDPKIIDVFICKIRRKLRQAFCNIPIETVWGRGYIVRKEI